MDNSLLPLTLQKVRITAFCLLTLAFSGCAQSVRPPTAGVTVAEVSSFTAIAPVVDSLNQQYGAENVLIVSDIDNTLLTSESDLGGDIWYQWQRGKLEVKPTKAQQVSCLFEDTIGLLYELAPMTLTESQVPDLLDSWQSAGNPVLLLTSRSPKYRAATERELARNGIRHLPNALTPLNHPNPVYRETLDREMSYSRGVMMTTGMNKGEMLSWILQKTNRSFDAVVFIDDSHANIVNMQNAWQQGPVDMHIFYYTHIEDERIAAQGTLLTPEQADKMAADYSALLQTLHHVFPARPADHCLAVN